MYLLRRTAVRALSTTPSKAFLVKPRSITTFTPAAFRSKQHQWAVASFQRRFASDEAAASKETASTDTAATETTESNETTETTETTETAETTETTATEAAEAAEAAVADTPDNFAQTAPEAPVEENLTPAQQEAQAPPTDAEATVTPEALNAAAKDPAAAPEARRRERPNHPPNKTLYVGNLFYEVKADQLKHIFSRFGEVQDVKLVYDNRGISRGFGYVEFSSTSEAQDAIDSLDMQVFEGRNLVVQFHKPREGRSAPGSSQGFARNNAAIEPSKTLFIGNMSFEMSDKDLNNLFRDIRNVMDVRVAIDRRTGQPRGFAHADFIDVSSAMRAKEVLQDKVIYGRQLRVDYSKSHGGKGGAGKPRERRNDSTQEE